MIIRTAHDDGDGLVLTLRPNGSLPWRAAKWCCAAMLLLTSAIAGWFALRGAWLVLPFAGAEMLLLGAALYLACRWSRQVEVIRVGPDSLVVQRGRSRPEEEHRFQRAWVRVILARDPTGWYPSRLLLRSHGRSLEVGARLVEEERQELAEALASLAAPKPRLAEADPLPVVPVRTRSAIT
ncbi:MAG: DUF2244 domain-containing protein [Gammaproteobacteria bacterium]|nr:DUF2244 domain-containing protein [Gammaproteobacteria bacterium]